MPFEGGRMTLSTAPCGVRASFKSFRSSLEASSSAIIWIHADILIPLAIRFVLAVLYKQRSSMDN